MYARFEGEQLTLRSWDYNCGRVLSALRNIVQNAGGRVKNYSPYALVTNYSLIQSIADCQRKIDRLNERMNSGAVLRTPERLEAIEKWCKELEELKSIPNEPIKMYENHQIIFVLDGHYYSVCLTDNPFGESYYIKTPIIRGNTFSRDAVGEDLPVFVAYDCMLGFHMKDCDCVELANQIYNGVLNARVSGISRDSHRVRVPNTYDDGYHYETKTEPERMGKIDF